MVILPDNKYKKYYDTKHSYSSETIICYAYEEDLIQIYDFYCSRYENISYDDFMNLGINFISKKLRSIPKNEPLYEIIKSRSIKLSTIKDKSEREYWRNLKEINKIPSIYISEEELNKKVKEKLGGIKR